MTFAEWVEKHQVGPGMNDRPGDTRYSGRDGTVGLGWIPLLDRLATDLVALGWQRGLSQVKEKFGTLRFYAQFKGMSSEQQATCWARIRLAEAESAKTCEACGSTIDVTTAANPGAYWIRTCCAACRGTNAAA